MTINTKAGVTRAIRRFEKAADDYAFRGTLTGHGPEGDKMLAAVDAEYAAAKKAIEDFMYWAVNQK